MRFRVVIGALCVLAAGFASTRAQQILDWEASARGYLDREFAASIDRVSVDQQNVTIAGQIPELSNDIAIGEFSLTASPFVARDGVIEATPLWVGEPLAASGAFERFVPRRPADATAPRDRLLSKWCLIRRTEKGLQLASRLHYADDIAAAHDLPSPTPANKKGIGGFDVHRGFTSDLDELDVAWVTVNVPLTFLRSSVGPGLSPHEFAGRTFYVDDAFLASLDETMLAAAARNIVVLAILLIPPASQQADPAIGAHMQHPDYQAPGIFTMPNVATDDGLVTYAAALDVLARRYNQPDGAHGRIHHWIAQNEVDADRTWTNAGEKTTLEYIDLYYKSLRTIDLVVRQYDAHARALVSLTHAWTGISEAHGHRPRGMLELLLRFSRAEGDFDWGLAHHPYPQSLLEPATWNDADAHQSLDTPFITFKNIEVLAAWARDKSTWFSGERPRAIHLTEQGFNSPDYSEATLQLQAAAMAYSWVKIRDLPEIQSMEYHNWIDNRGEGGLRIGLRKFPDDADDPGGKKPIWNVFRAIGTPDEAAATAFALPLVGVDSWDAVPYRGNVPQPTTQPPPTSP